MQIHTPARKNHFWQTLAVLAAIGSLAAPIALAQAAPKAPKKNWPWMNTSLSPMQRANLVLKQMTLDEKIDLLHGNGMPNAGFWKMPLTYLANGGAGAVVGVPRLGIPPIVMDDDAYGVRNSGINGRYSTAMPSDLALASSWDTKIACRYGEILGSELRDQGYNMTLGGGVNLDRDPRDGRTFEFAGEDPLLAGTMVGHMMKCEQAQHVIGDIKHYAMNDQETGRNFVNAIISKRGMQESDLLAFHIAISIAHPGAVMCSYNRVNGDFSCQNPYLLRDTLKNAWHFKGFVLSDWGGTHSTVRAIKAGLDQEQPMDIYFGPKLKQAVLAGKVSMAEINDSARRVLYSEFADGLVDHPIQKMVPDVRKGFRVAERVEEHSIVLLKNQDNILPLDPARIHTIAIIGGHADVGMISGGGSAQVDPPGGNVIAPPGHRATYWQAHIWFPTSPLKALRHVMPNTKITYNSGDDLASAEALAKSSDVAIVFAHQWESEGMDLPNLSLPGNQNQLIESIAAANPRTIVVLETGTAVTMPWLDKVQGVVEAWFAGSSGHKALANVLIGKVNPSARLAMTFPLSENELPRKQIPPLPASVKKAGMAAVMGKLHQLPNYSVNYFEGAKVGYKWYEAEHKPVLFPFGFGLSYTTYSYSNLTVAADDNHPNVTFTVTNTGQRAGTEIAEVYASLPSASGENYRRLVGWSRVKLDPGQSKTVTVTVSPQMLSIYDTAKSDWQLLPGEYHIYAGPSSAATPLEGSIHLN
ncbi:MAG: beta-glucosidase [Acidobacteriaceae bacterium]